MVICFICFVNKKKLFWPARIWAFTWMYDIMCDFKVIYFQRFWNVYFLMISPFMYNSKLLSFEWLFLMKWCEYEEFVLNFWKIIRSSSEQTKITKRSNDVCFRTRLYIFVCINSFFLTNKSSERFINIIFEFFMDVSVLYDHSIIRRFS